MNGTTHRVFGVVTGACILYEISGFALTANIANNPVITPLVLAGAFVGSTFPDSDMVMKRITKFKPLAFLKDLLFSHRGLTHTPVLSTIAPILVYLMNKGEIGNIDIVSVMVTAVLTVLYTDNPFILLGMMGATVLSNSIAISLLIGFAWGWISHIIADAFNRKGVPLLFPLSRTRIHLASFSTGTWQEYAWLVLFLCLVVIRYGGFTV